MSCLLTNAKEVSWAASPDTISPQISEFLVSSCSFFSYFWYSAKHGRNQL